MTEAQLRNKVVSIAKGYLGYKESNGSHKMIIDEYNSARPLPRGYKVTYKDSWCATFVSFVGIKAGLQDIIHRECSCAQMIELYKKRGRWIEKDSYVPKAGDIIMYDWNDSGKGDCAGHPEHVGIVVSIKNNSIKVIEGNKSNAVGYRDIPVNGRHIRGYCVPNYTIKTSSVQRGLNKSVKQNGTVSCDFLNVRTWAGVDNKTCSFSPLKKNAVVGICDYVKDNRGVVWYYIKYKGKYGFVSSKYINK